MPFVVNKWIRLLFVSILHFRKELIAPPVAPRVANVAVRAMDVPADMAAWLRLRVRATSELHPRPREWNEADFRTEMLGKRWWRTEHCWVAVAGNLSNGPSEIVGSVTLALREGEASTVPVVHWLLVDPAWRRRGIGQLLMSQLEQAAWHAGWREVQLETHAGWAAAIAFYQSMGYAPVRDRSPR